jgi:hypothetical protein
VLAHGGNRGGGHKSNLGLDPAMGMPSRFVENRYLGLVRIGPIVISDLRPGEWCRLRGKGIEALRRDPRNRCSGM